MCQCARKKVINQLTEVSGEDDGLRAESGGTNLRDERVADRADTDVIDEGEDDEERSDGPSSAVGGMDGAENGGKDHDAGKYALSV